MTILLGINDGSDRRYIRRQLAGRGIPLRSIHQFDHHADQSHRNHLHPNWPGIMAVIGVLTCLGVAAMVIKMVVAVVVGGWR
jgi:hypothetical protein